MSDGPLARLPKPIRKCNSGKADTRLVLIDWGRFSEPRGSARLAIFSQLKRAKLGRNRLISSNRDSADYWCSLASPTNNKRLEDNFNLDETYFSHSWSFLSFGFNSPPDAPWSKFSFAWGWGEGWSSTPIEFRQHDHGPYVWGVLTMAHISYLRADQASRLFFHEFG